MVGYVDEYAASAAVMVRIEAAADDSLLAILALSKFGIAITAMINMMATTISSSIKEKPLCLRSLFPKVNLQMTTGKLWWAFERPFSGDRSPVNDFCKLLELKILGVFLPNDPESPLPRLPN